MDITEFWIFLHILKILQNLIKLEKAGAAEQTKVSFCSM